MTWREKCSSMRQWFPPKGRQYELFDISTFLFMISLVAFVLIEPPKSVLNALQGPLQVVSETQLGFAVLVCAATGIVLSYHIDYLKIGYMLPRIAATFMMLNFAISMIVLTVNWIAMFWCAGFLPDGFELGQTFRASFVYFMIFAWATRRLSRDETE